MDSAPPLVPNLPRIGDETLMSQLDMFGSPPVRTPKLPAPEDVRPELASVLELLRTSDTMPLSAKDLRFWRTVFPQMSRWLPDAEREAMCASFQTEVVRLDSLSNA